MNPDDYSAREKVALINYSTIIDPVPIMNHVLEILNNGVLRTSVTSDEMHIVTGDDFVHVLVEIPSSIDVFSLNLDYREHHPLVSIFDSLTWEKLMGNIHRFADRCGAVIE